MTLTEFLLARIAEDEGLARVATPGPWERDSGWSITAPPPEDWAGPYVIVETTQRNDAEYVVRHDPARVLAECEAKRAIVQRERANGIGRPDAFPWNIATLAAVYADHPDYREEWKP